MNQARTAIEIDAPPGKVWSHLTEVRYWPEWGPSVRAVELDLEGEAIGAGVTGRVQTAVGIWLPFEITRFEAERYWDWSVAGFRATGHRLTALAEHRTRVEFTVPRIFKPYVWVLDRGLRRLERLATRPPR